MPENLQGEQCTRTYEVYALPYIGYTNTIILDRHSLFMLDHFQAWDASKGILLEPLTAYHQQPDGLTEIVNKEVLTEVRACESEAD